MDYNTTRTRPQQFLSVSGYKIEVFDQLFLLFEPLFWEKIEKVTLQGKPRKAKFSFRNSGFKNAEEAFFFICSYLKNNPTQDYHAWGFGISQDLCNKWIHFLTPVLRKSLRDFEPRENEITEEEAQEELIIDATERTVQRDTYEQEHYYSGKKKRHTIKNVAIVNLCGLILAISPTVYGSIHDKALSDEMKIPNDAHILADSGFQGMQHTHPNTQLPYKKPKNGELSSKKKTQ